MAQRAKKSNTKQFDVQPSSDNVFADLGLPDAEELSTRANYALSITRAIKTRKLKQKEAAKVLGIDQPKVSAIMNGRLDGFSSDRLELLLKKMGGHVTTSIQMPVAGARSRVHHVMVTMRSRHDFHLSGYSQKKSLRKRLHRLTLTGGYSKVSSQSRSYRVLDSKELTGGPSQRKIDAAYADA